VIERQLEKFQPGEHCPSPDAARDIVRAKVNRYVRRMLFDTSPGLAPLGIGASELGAAIESRLIRSEVVSCSATEANCAGQGNCPLTAEDLIFQTTIPPPTT
jgi:hypothetical protein